MAAATPYESELRSRSSRLRRRRLADGACRLIVAAAAIAATLVALDAAFELSLAARCALELAGLGILILLARQFLWQPWFDLDDEPPINTSEAPAPLARLAGFAAAVVACTMLALGLPGAGQRLRRAALPWQRTAVHQGFDIVVTSGDAVVRRGDPVTLTAYLRPHEPRATLPSEAVLVVRETAEAPETRFPMSGEAPTTFFATRPAAAADFDYRIEAGSAASAWHAIRIADAVELTGECRTEIVAPAYCRLEPATQPGFRDFEAWQFSRVRFHLPFNRPAESAVLEWRAAGGSSTELPESIAVVLAADRRSGEAAFEIRQSGTLRLVLVNEDGPRKLRTEHAIAVHARIDAPPRFERIAGIAPLPCTVLPEQRLTFELTAADDLGLAAAELEVARAGRSERIAIPLVPGNRRRAEGRVLFDLKGTEGEVIRVRLCLRDNRDAAAKLGSQEAFYPASGWMELRIARTAPPLESQLVFGLRDSLRKLLTELLDEAKAIRAEAEDLLQQTADVSPLPLDQAYRMEQLRERIRKGSMALENAAREAALTAEARSLAAQLRNLAERSFADADDALRQAATDDAGQRVARLKTALARWRDATSGLADAAKGNDRLAQNRVDARKLAALAADQDALAVLAKPGSPATTAELSKRVRTALNGLNAIVAESEPLRQGMQAAQARERVAWAVKLHTLAESLRALDDASNRNAAELRHALLADLAASQMQLVKEADSLLAKCETIARWMGAALPRREELVRIAELLQQDRIIEALTELERLAEAFDHQAGEFDRGAAERADAKLAARQLAKWQDDLRERFLAAEKQPETKRADFHREQQALLFAVEQLKLPRLPATLERRQEALVQVRGAVKALAADGRGAADAMLAAAAALGQIADKLPDNEERLAAARPLFEKLRNEQNDLTAVALKILAPFEKQPPSAALHQAAKARLAQLRVEQLQIAQRLVELDLPGLGSRQARAVRAAQDAAADMNDGLSSDSIASLASCKRELERLRQALDRMVPADARIEELAAKQRALARAYHAAGEQPTVPQREALAAGLQAIAAQLAEAGRGITEAQDLLYDARNSVKRAEAGLRDENEVLVVRLFAAADALQLLADRLNGRESDRDRIRRLAANRRQGVCIARQLAGRPLDPMESGRAALELKYEADELQAVRVGAAGQQARKLALNLYAKLQDRVQPDRLGDEHKKLAEALERLAATLDKKAVPAAAIDNLAEAWLPNRDHADSLRGLARRLRDLRLLTASLGAEMIRLAKAAGANPLAASVKRQAELVSELDDWARSLGAEPERRMARTAIASARDALREMQLGDIAAGRKAMAAAVRQLRTLIAAEKFAATQEAITAALPQALDPAEKTAQHQARTRELAREIGAFADRLARAKSLTDAAEAQLLAKAEASMRQADSRLADAGKELAAGHTHPAARDRAEAHRELLQAENLLRTSAAGTVARPEVGSAIREADRALRESLLELERNPDRAAVEAALRRAAAALHRAAGLPKTAESLN